MSAPAKLIKNIRLHPSTTATTRHTSFATNYLHSRPRNTLIDRRPALVTRIIGTQTENTGIEMATQTSQEQTSIATQTSTIETPPSTSGTAVKFEKLRAALAKIEVPPRNAVKSKPTCGCYCESEDNDFIFTKCGHPFHARCLQKWMNSTSRSTSTK